MDFQGFQHILPPAVIVIIIVALLLLTWASYRKFESIPLQFRWFLVFLRGTALVLILLLLLNPYFYSSKEVEVKPKIAVFLDNSESVDINKEDYMGLETYNNLLNTLNFDGVGEVDFEFYSIGETVSVFSPDTLDASDTQTNLSSPIQSVLEMAGNVQAAVIISDGIITYGRNPSVNASRSSIPIYTIGIGDTSKVRDISVTNVFTNPTGYTNTNHIIEAEISQSGFANNNISISLIHEDTVLDEQQITFEADDQVKQIQFEHELQEEGLQQFEIRATPLPDEWTASNNSRLFSIDVLDSKVKILHVAFAIHPDVKAVRSIIRKDQNNELTTLTWLGGNRFVEDFPDEDEFNLIIIHGKPAANQDFEFLSSLSETPTILFAVSPSTESRYNTLNRISLIEQQTNRAYQVTLNQLLNADQHPIVELPEIILAEAPPLFSPLRSELSTLQSTALYSINFEGEDMDYPAMAILEQGNIRRAHILPWGWYQMTQSNNSLHRDYISTLLSNLISWTSSDPDNRKLRISPTKKTFNTSESPVLNGSLLNERGDPESEGIIEVKLETEDSETQTFNMENSGNGNYRLSLPRLSEGLYKYQAMARKGDREIESQNGEFLVSNSSSELTNTIRNDALLRSIAFNSGGDFFTYKNAETLWDSLNRANLMESQTEVVENYAFPVRSIYWFLVVLLLLGTEWFIRKYFSLP